MLLPFHVSTNITITTTNIVNVVKKFKRYTFVKDLYSTYFETNLGDQKKQWLLINFVLWTTCSKKFSNFDNDFEVKHHYDDCYF